MQYFSFNHSLDPKIIGKYPQSVNVKQMVITGIKARDIIVLEKKAKVTDLINVIFLEYSYKRVISGKLKDIVEKKQKLNFEEVVLFSGTTEIEDYWALSHQHNIHMEYVDYTKSEILLRKRKPEGGTYTVKEEVSSEEEFYFKRDHYRKNKMGLLYISKIALHAHIKDDFFLLKDVEGGTKYIVSETLKEEIEKSGCSGMEFQPIELNTKEWIGSERIKIYGKA